MASKHHDHGCHGHAVEGLNETQRRVHAILEAAPGPMSAYEVLDRMREAGAVTPPTIYRSLDKLIEKGLAHRLESLNAYVSCKHPHPQEMAAFAICETCGSVNEFSDPHIDERLAHWSGIHSFQPKKVTVEVRGLCEACQSPEA
ncbi:Fur family transcriptional regulator [Microvirga pudoricolor]|uniref:Fur family transcriptional regulator n=1 Tax=Microvirga pudoricolor TaxID=2778729 RepID=UPI00194DB6EB|nr:Fur family transcriptional regulator [Microvirga pudoricolor]MBM6594819.1 transcriptional repressor [Microvirga pudoricolor]